MKSTVFFDLHAFNIIFSREVIIIKNFNKRTGSKRLDTEEGPEATDAELRATGDGELVLGVGAEGEHCVRALEARRRAQREIRERDWIHGHLERRIEQHLSITVQRSATNATLESS